MVMNNKSRAPWLGGLGYGKASPSDGSRVAQLTRLIIDGMLWQRGDKPKHRPSPSPSGECEKSKSIRQKAV